MCLLTVCISSWGKKNVYSSLSPIFKIRLFFVVAVVVELWEFFIYSGYYPLSDIWFANIFSHSVSCLFILLKMSLMHRRFKSFFFFFCDKHCFIQIAKGWGLNMVCFFLTSFAHLWNQKRRGHPWASHLGWPWLTDTWVRELAHPHIVLLNTNTPGAQPRLPGEKPGISFSGSLLLWRRLQFNLSG